MMSKSKTAATAIIMIIVTFAVILVPAYINSKKIEAYLNRTEYTEYSRHTNEITPHTAAEKYIYITNTPPGMLYNTTQTRTKENIRGSLDKTLYSVFGESESLYGLIKDALNKSDIEFKTASILVSDDNIPVALNYVSATIYNNDLEIEITVNYEEKTSALLYLNWTTIYSEDESENFDLNEKTGIESILYDYFYSVLKLPQSNYFFDSFFPSPQYNITTFELIPSQEGYEKG